MSPWGFNLYMEPKEQGSSGHSRFEWGLPQALQKAGRHNATFEKYPRTDSVLQKPGQERLGIFNRLVDGFLLEGIDRRINLIDQLLPLQRLRRKVAATGR